MALLCCCVAGVRPGGWPYAACYLRLRGVACRLQRRNVESHLSAGVAASKPGWRKLAIREAAAMRLAAAVGGCAAQLLAKHAAVQPVAGDLGACCAAIGSRGREKKWLTAITLRLAIRTMINADSDR